MSRKNNIKGVWTALITPFDDRGQVDLDAFARLVELQIRAGVAGLVVSGTTGEAPTLTNDEKLALIECCRDVAGSSIGVMAGTGNNNTKTSVSLSQAAIEAGADSLLIVTPPYNKPSLEGLKLHFSTIARAVEAPVCLYHVPGRTAQKLTAEQLAELSKIDGISAVKEASADIALFADCERLCTNISMLSGDDPTYLASLAVGGVGCISVVSNVFPRAMVEMTEAAMAGDFTKARRINRALLPAIHALFVESNPAPTKYVLAQQGIGQNMLRAPLVTVSSANAALINARMQTAQKELVG